jgi:hypothetical protein
MNLVRPPARATDTELRFPDIPAALYSCALGAGEPPTPVWPAAQVIRQSHRPRRSTKPPLCNTLVRVKDLTNYGSAMPPVGKPPRMKCILLSDRPHLLQGRGAEGVPMRWSSWRTQLTQVDAAAFSHIALHARSPGVPARTIAPQPDGLGVKFAAEYTQGLEQVWPLRDPGTVRREQRQPPGSSITRRRQLPPLAAAVDRYLDVVILSAHIHPSHRRALPTTSPTASMGQRHRRTPNRA